MIESPFAPIAEGIPPGPFGALVTRSIPWTVYFSSLKRAVDACLARGEVVMIHDLAAASWKVYAPDSGPVDTRGTYSQGLVEAMNYANTQGYDLRILGGGTGPGAIPQSTIRFSQTVTMPAGNHRRWHFGAVNFAWDGPPADDMLVIDSMDVSYLDLLGVQFVYVQGTGACVRFKPTHLIDNGAFTGMTSSTILLGTIANDGAIHAGSSGVRVSCADHAIVGMNLWVQEIANMEIGFLVDTPTGTPSTSFELNKIHLAQVHNISGTALKIGTSATNASHLSGNQWSGLLNTGQDNAKAIDTYSSHDSFHFTIRSSTVGTSGVILQSSADGNIFVLPTNDAATPWTDSSTAKNHLRYEPQRGISGYSPVTFANVPATPFHGMMVPITDSNTVVWGAAIAGGAANKVMGYYNGAAWNVMGK